ncbi:MAG: 50S ribosomal protein L13 [bacterium]|nr:50S ribosomal protein L13 [bacterium]
MKSSTSIKPQTVQREWHEIDVADQILGRVSSQIAKLLLGKGKPYFVNHQDVGDYVVVVNADKIKVTGNKLDQKIYYHHSGYPGGMKTRTLAQMMDKDSRKVLEKAIRGMLPKTKLGDDMFRKLFVYSDSDHPYKSKLRTNVAKGDK